MLRKIIRRKFSVSTDPDAHSPFAKAIKGTLEKRSELFPERLAIPGRRAKYVFAFGIMVNMIGWKNWLDIHRTFRWQDEHHRKVQRKAVPFLQAMEDIRYVALEDRAHILIDELFSSESEEYRESLKSPYFQKDVW